MYGAGSTGSWQNMKLSNQGQRGTGLKECASCLSSWQQVQEDLEMRHTKLSREGDMRDVVDELNCRILNKLKSLKLQNEE